MMSDVDAAVAEMLNAISTPGFSGHMEADRLAIIRAVFVAHRPTVAVTEAGVEAVYTFFTTPSYDQLSDPGKAWMIDGIRTALRASGVGVVPSRERLVDEFLTHVRICPDCHGYGELGGRGDDRVACETCGGHEDAAGTGLLGLYDFADAVLDFIGGQRD